MTSTRNHAIEITAYIAELNRQYASPKPTEHSYRPALAQLLKELLPQVNPSNEQGRTECGAPDYVLLRLKDNIPIAYIEAKDIGDPDLNGQNKNKEQFDRYKNALDSIIFTDYLDFIFCKQGSVVESVRVGEINNGRIAPIRNAFDKFQSLIEAFAESSPQTIKSPASLANIMANKARLMANVFEESLTKLNGDSTLTGQMTAFKSYLIHDISAKEFADLYAQTIAYGLFAARIHDTSIDAFSRKSAAELIPKTNPFLRNLFQTIAGFDLDRSISWIVDDLAQAFRATDISAVLEGIGQTSKHTDPLIHFYEDFLTAYDPMLRKSRGVWYTPKPVVKFIVSAVDEILKTEFKLPKGLADSSKIRIKPDKNTQLEVHKVQILDPATGTGTFLAETVRQINEQYKDQAGAWQSYVEQNLIPRLNAFEILMAPYAMAHLKLDRLLAETGYIHKGNQRLRIFLTNSLEEHHPDTGTLFAQFLANEAREANSVKKNCPVMVIMGNPPYSISTSNKGEWINNQLQDYKKGLNEKNIQPLSDDFIKFIRLGQYYIEKNGEGILAYISNNSFIDGLIHRQMRKSLLEVFDKIYILDLHGNAKRKETSPDGSKDENVFDIQQGVSINIFVKTNTKTNKKAHSARVFHYDLFGKRDEKYSFLSNTSLDKVPWSELALKDDRYFFVPKDFELKDEYEAGFKIDELFPVNSSGVTTHDDSNLVNFDPFDKNNHQYAYRPFDIRNINYDLKKVVRHRYSVMKNFILGSNIGLVISRQTTTNTWSHVQIIKEINDRRIHYSNKGAPVSCPLFLYSDHNVGFRIPNLNIEIVNKIAQIIKLGFEPEKSSNKNKFAPIDILDYVYAVLHSPSYRNKYKEFLKIDFPRVPYPTSATQFHHLAKFGSELRLLHLMDHPELQKIIRDYPFPMSGDNMVDRLRWEASIDSSTGKVWINNTQYFDKVPLTVWEFYIGGYRPAQKWLKDRKGRRLAFEDIEHYQKIITALEKTDEIMRKIDE
ncbi:MAG: N-6 DNA methylase [Holophagaceae bacterium]|nr:N-6 DNA methylase [Holophagaceae bacterium]